MIASKVVDALLFPGQGSQSTGMGKDIYESSEVARAIFDKANETLPIDIKALCFEGSDEELRKTENTQPALFTVSMAYWQMLREAGLKGKYVAGHSLGEISAIVCAGFVSFEDALNIVYKRGQIMSVADKEGKGTMSAILGLAPEKVASLCEEDNGIVVPANYNSKIQVVISGEKDAVERVSEKAKEAGAKRIVPLSVSGAFHSPLMKEAAEEFRSVLESVEFFESDVKALSNVTAKEHIISEIKDRLVEQIYSPVRWVECMEYLASQGITNYIELGPGKVLGGLMKKIDSEGVVNSVASLSDYEKLVESLS